MLDWSGVAIGAATLLIIGIFHPVVVACEYYLTDKVWPAFLVAGLACFGASLWAGDAVVSGILGVLGCTLVWCVRELKEQTQRVAKGWARRHPKRARDARLRRRAVSIDESTLLDDAGMPRQDALASMRGLTSRKVPFFIVSARAPRDVYAILDAHGIRCPVIAHGGAAIFDEGRALISSRGMGPGEVVDVLAFVGTRVPCHAWHACPIEDRASIGGPAPCPRMCSWGSRATSSHCPSHAGRMSWIASMARWGTRSRACPSSGRLGTRSISDVAAWRSVGPSRGSAGGSASHWRTWWRSTISTTKG